MTISLGTSNSRRFAFPCYANTWMVIVCSLTGSLPHFVSSFTWFRYLSALCRNCFFLGLLFATAASRSYFSTRACLTWAWLIAFPLGLGFLGLSPIVFARQSLLDILSTFFKSVGILNSPCILLMLSACQKQRLTTSQEKNTIGSYVASDGHPDGS